MGTRRTSASKGAPLSAFQRIQDQLKWVDLIFEVRDARAPFSSGHPGAGGLFGNKPRVVVLAKQDLAEPETLKEWLDAMSGRAENAAIALSLKQTRGKDRLISLALELTAARREAHARKGLLPRPIRVCVVGMPNVGKSSLINWLIGRRKTLVGDRPGITKGAQWVRLHAQLELLDTPGILPNTELPETIRTKLAVLNLLPENVYDYEYVAQEGIILLEDKYPGMLAHHYGLSAGTLVTLAEIARKRNCLGPGGRADTRRAATLLLNDLRDGKLGRITLDSPLTVGGQL